MMSICVIHSKQCSLFAAEKDSTISAKQQQSSLISLKHQDFTMHGLA